MPSETSHQPTSCTLWICPGSLVKQQASLLKPGCFDFNACKCLEDIFVGPTVFQPFVQQPSGLFSVTLTKLQHSPGMPCCSMCLISHCSCIKKLPCLAAVATPVLQHCPCLSFNPTNALTIFPFSAQII